MLSTCLYIATHLIVSTLCSSELYSARRCPIPFIVTNSTFPTNNFMKPKDISGFLCAGSYHGDAMGQCFAFTGNSSQPSYSPLPASLGSPNTAHPWAALASAAPAASPPITWQCSYARLAPYSNSSLKAQPPLLSAKCQLIFRGKKYWSTSGRSKGMGKRGKYLSLC